MSITLLIFGTVAALLGAVLLYGSLWPSGRWDSWWERSWVVVSGAGWFAMACRWLIRDQWEVRQLRRGGES